MTTPHTPCAEAIEAMLNVEYSPTPLARCDEDELHEMRVWMAKRLTAALPHLRRQIVAECLVEVDAEPELPGDMPDEMWALIRNDRYAMQTAGRVAVRLTKEGIAARLRALLDAPTKEGEDE